MVGLWRAADLQSKGIGHAQASVAILPCYGSDFTRVFFGPAASTSPGNMLEMQITGPFPTSTELETRGWGREMCFNETSQCKMV